MYNEASLRIIYVDDDGYSQTVDFDSDEYLNTTRTESRPVITQTTQKNVEYSYIPSNLNVFSFSIQIRVRKRTTLDKVRAIQGRQVDLYPYFGDLGSVLDLQEINYTELDYFDTNSFTGIIVPELSSNTFKSLPVKNEVITVQFRGFYRKVPAGIRDIILTSRMIILETYESLTAMSALTRGVAPDDSYTARGTSSGHDLNTTDHIDITGASPSGFNVVNERILSVPTSGTNFTFAVDSSVSSPATVAGSFKKRSKLVGVTSQIRVVVSDISGGNYPVSVYLREYYGNGLGGDWLFTAFDSWKSKTFYIHVPYRKTTLADTTDYNGFYLAPLAINVSFNTGLNDPENWYELGTLSLTPDEWTSFQAILDDLGIP